MYFIYTLFHGNRDTVLVKATHYRLDGPEIETR
jgi:hypothetical protein